MPLFDFAPTVDMLQLLASGSSLKQSLPKALRLWAILRSLYGDEADSHTILLDRAFTSRDWSNLFFIDADQHHRGRDRSNVPLHSPDCPCAKSCTDWLFGDPYYADDANMQPDNWKAKFLHQYPLKATETIENLLTTGTVSGTSALNDSRLFAVSGKTIENHFDDLVRMGWLQIEPKTESGSKVFTRVSEFPNLPHSKSEDSSEIGKTIRIEDLASFLAILGQEINGVRRFFIDLEYIVPSQLADRVEVFQDTLRSVWEKADIPPIRITYISARLYQAEIERTAFPVCVRYHQRAPYLYAYGESPSDPLKIEWYDYRLDRIADLKPMTWLDPLVPDGLRQKHHDRLLPTVGDIERALGAVLGYDFFRDRETMVLCFDKYFFNNYVHGTERTTIFRPIEKPEAEKIILRGDRPHSRELLANLQVAATRDPVFCKAEYYSGDYAPIHRLRAWGAMVEVLFPRSLRLKMAEEALLLAKIYDYRP
jgi:CRISPR-associated protein (TIGR03985 family)